MSSLNKSRQVSDSSQEYNCRFSPAAQSRQHPQPPPRRGFDRFNFPLIGPPHESMEPELVGAREDVSEGGAGGRYGFISVGLVSFVFLTEMTEPDMSSETTESGRNLMDLLRGLETEVGMEADEEVCELEMVFRVAIIR
jgi:hypothetical protein